MGKKQNRIRKASEIEKVTYKELISNYKIPEAIKELEKLYNRYPDDKTIIFDLATLYVGQEVNFTKGKLLFEVIRDYKYTFSIDYELGKYYLRNRMFSEAEDCFTKLLAGSKVVECKGLLNLTVIYISQGRYEEALERYSELLSIADECQFGIPHRSQILYFLLHKNNKSGKEYEGQFKTDDYYAHQIRDYNSLAAISFITKDTDPDNPQKVTVDKYSIIYRKEDITALFNTCEDYIQFVEPDGYCGSGDYYIVPVDHVVGETMSRTKSNIIEVLTIPNTKFILAMRPTTETHLRRNFETDIDPKPIKRKELNNPDCELPFEF